MPDVMPGIKRKFSSMIDLRRLRAVSRKEVLQLRRDPKSLGLSFLLPILLLALFGYAITWDVEDIRTGIVDYDNSSSSRGLVDALRSSGYFSIRAILSRAPDIEPLLERGYIQMGLVIPPGFSADLAGGRAAPLQAIIDGSDANTATVILGYTRAIVETYSQEIAAGGRRAPPPLAVDSRVWFNEDIKSRVMIIPGLIPVIMMIIAALLTSLTIAREWEHGTMEQLASTPVTRQEIVLGKLLPYLGIGIIDLVVSCGLGVLIFGVPFRGDPFLLLLLSFFFLVGALGLGIFISAASKSQLLATQIALLATFLPAYLLSGFMFSIDVMPAPLRAITYLVPARYFLVVTRGIFLKGVGLDILYVQAMLMIVFAAAGLISAIRVFKKVLA